MIHRSILSWFGMPPPAGHGCTGTLLVSSSAGAALHHFLCRGHAQSVRWHSAPQTHLKCAARQRPQRILVYTARRMRRFGVTIHTMNASTIGCPPWARAPAGCSWSRALASGAAVGHPWDTPHPLGRTCDFRDELHQPVEPGKCRVGEETSRRAPELAAPLRARWIGPLQSWLLGSGRLEDHAPIGTPKAFSRPFLFPRLVHLD